jgi:excisionase family DNA binding protein
VTGRLLTCREVAEWLDVGVETVLRWHRRGELPGFKLPGGTIRFREAELEAWLEARATGATSRGDDSHHDGRAHRGGYARLQSLATVTTPPEAATTEEEP